jgi:hypothetical protein
VTSPSPQPSPICRCSQTYTDKTGPPRGKRCTRSARLLRIYPASLHTPQRPATPETASRAGSGACFDRSVWHGEHAAPSDLGRRQVPRGRIIFSPAGAPSAPQSPGFPPHSIRPLPPARGRAPRTRTDRHAGQEHPPDSPKGVRVGNALVGQAVGAAGRLAVWGPPSGSVEVSLRMRGFP